MKKGLKTLPIDLDDVICVGTNSFLVLKVGRNIKFPSLHFITYRCRDGGVNGVMALCLEFGLFYWDRNERQAEDVLIDLCKTRVKNILSNEFDEKKIVEAFFSKTRNVEAEPYWQVYRLIKFRNALRELNT